jgi:hypothetical protein
MDGTSVSDTTILNFWERTAKVGDVVYHDGTYTSQDELDSMMESGKTPIGICFYIDPYDKTHRLMMGLSYIPSTNWGCHSTTQSITLQDNPNLSIFDIDGIPNISSVSTKKYS